MNDEEDIYDAVRQYRKDHPEPKQEAQEELWEEVRKEFSLISAWEKKYPEVLKILSQSFQIIRKPK